MTKPFVWILVMRQLSSIADWLPKRQAIADFTDVVRINPPDYDDAYASLR